MQLNKCCKVIIVTKRLRKRLNDKCSKHAYKDMIEGVKS